MNILPCRIERDESKLTIQIVETDDIPNWSIDRSEPFASVLEKARLPRVDLGIRPEQILVRSIDAPTDRFEGSAIVKRLEPTGHETLVYLDCGSQELTARLPARTSFRVGDPVRISNGRAGSILTRAIGSDDRSADGKAVLVGCGRASARPTIFGSVGGAHPMIRLTKDLRKVGSTHQPLKFRSIRLLSPRPSRSCHRLDR
jgi:hypothetical protein